MLTIAMKSNVLHIFTACEYYHMCVDELLILFVSSVESLLAVLCPTPVLQFFKSALVLNHSFKDCLPQVNPGHMNIFMKKDPSPRFGLCI